VDPRAKPWHDEEGDLLRRRQLARVGVVFPPASAIQTTVNEKLLAQPKATRSQKSDSSRCKNPSFHFVMLAADRGRSKAGHLRIR
jgi:hypothetical protein